MPRHTPQERFAILERQRSVAGHYLQGQTQWEIANALEVSQKTVSLDLKAIRAEWVAATVADMDGILAEELARLKEIERQCWDGWERSQANAETLKVKMRGKGEDAVAETEKTIKSQVGDPRFLALVLECVEERAKILGLYEYAKKSRQKDPDEDEEPPNPEEICIAINRIFALYGATVPEQPGPGPGEDGTQPLPG